jgi:hypothetical protein
MLYHICFFISYYEDNTKRVTFLYGVAPENHTLSYFSNYELHILPRSDTDIINPEAEFIVKCREQGSKLICENEVTPTTTPPIEVHFKQFPFRISPETPPKEAECYRKTSNRFASVMSFKMLFNEFEKILMKY